MHIVEIFRQEFGIKTCMAFNYIRRARNEIMKRAGKTKEEFRADSLWHYMKIVNDPKASNKDKISALARRDSILGLDAPTRVMNQHSGNINHKISVEFSSTWPPPFAIDAEDESESNAELSAAINN